MSKVVVLAVDPKSHVSAAVEMARELSGDSGDKVIVLHVHEFAVGRWGRMQVDCGEGEGEGLVSEIVTSLKDARIAAEGEIREAQLGHIARAGPRGRPTQSRWPGRRVRRPRRECSRANGHGGRRLMA
jgi:hypothetical protein